MASKSDSRRGAWETLCDYLVQASSRKPALLRYIPRVVSAATAVREDALIVETEGAARVAVLLAEALLQMSADIHDPDDRASASGAIGHAEALVLVRRHDGVRPAARATGLSKDAIFRALKREEVRADYST